MRNGIISFIEEGRRKKWMGIKPKLIIETV
jgi:hypothetical protein